MRPVEVPFDSDALRANIAGTAQEVIIPDRYLPLVQAVAGLYGVRADLMGTLAEYFHGFRNVDHLIDGFQTILLRDWTYFERSDDRARCFELLSELVLGLLEPPPSEGQTSLVLRQLLSWCTAALGGPHADSYGESVLTVGESLARALPEHPLAFLERDALLRGLFEQVTARPALEPVFTRLYRDLLLLGYRRLRERLPVPQWARSSDAGLADPAAVAAHFPLLAPERISGLVGAAETAALPELLAPELPLFSAILDEAIDKVFLVDDLEDRFTVCLYFLKDDTLGYRQNEVISDLLGVVRQLMKPERHTDVDRILSRLTRFFRTHDTQFLLMRFQCYETIGVAIGEVGNAEAADHLIEDVLSWLFQYPDVRGATDEWETVVNPFHLPNIRCWMHIIESNPSLYERLAAALNVQLRLGGVHVADTDLFQRDVTRFLNADIRPIYFVAKQLLRAFPVYFNDVGAEGELRSVSTEMDEICGRRDTLLHFLRKQSHAESSNRLVTFSRAVLSYWVTLDPSGLEPYLSAHAMDAVRRELEWAQGPHDVVLGLRAAMDDGSSAEDRGDAAVETLLDRLVALSPSALEALVRGLDVPEGNGSACARRVALMIRTHQLLSQKYSLSASDVGPAVSNHLPLHAKVRLAFAKALGAWQKHPTPAARDRLLDVALTVLERLKAIVLDPVPSLAEENLYQKRHIAAGIPSIYGNYNEAKFDALGLSFRVEGLVARLLEDLVVEGIETHVNRDSLRNMAAAIRRFERALAADGVYSSNLAANLLLLESSLSSRSFTFHQYRNVFQFIVGSVTELSRTSILSHDQVLRTVLEHDARQCETRCLSLDATAEMVLREVLVAALGMQALDRYVAAALRQISTLAGRLSNRALTRMMNYDPERLVSPIHQAKPETDDQRTLGFKGLGLKQMASYGHRVPEGFILTTELFRVRPALSHRPLYDDTIERIRAALGRLERETRLRLGDPKRLLTLSIRSGAAVSMPGSMATFVNVGLNDTLAEALSRKPGFEWAAWDSYRRFLQSWAMTSGVDRDFFDEIMTEFKTRYGIERKLDFLPEHMRELALTYKSRARDLGVRFSDDPFAQVIDGIKKVLESWDSPEARLYRRYLGIAAEWGTAVVVQRMVFGNLSRESGSGVTFTHNPTEPHSRQVRLFGDFTARSQGEDLVGGLVYPLPISEAQRIGSPTCRVVEHSLEKDYPGVYQALLEVARDLANARDFDPQEIEFTFESASGEDLYILQKRAMVQEQGPVRPYFDTSSSRFGSPVAVGTGVSGGAYSGRVAITSRNIEELLKESPDDDIVLLRPDTVPEDIAMITRVSGLLTARGGSTSHAAVTAKRLGKTAVVDCRELDVIEQKNIAVLAGKKVKVGDWLSIDGRTGNIFRGQLPIVARPLSSLLNPCAVRTPPPPG
jgi:pyruvate,orthophosphate dikinase